MSNNLINTIKLGTACTYMPSCNVLIQTAVFRKRSKRLHSNDGVDEEDKHKEEANVEQSWDGCN